MGQKLRPETVGALRIFGNVRSGRTAGRAGLQEPLACPRPGDAPFVSRPGRWLTGVSRTLDILGNRRIAFLGLEGGIDTASAAGEPVSDVLGAVIHSERRAISGRTKNGIVTARLKGRHPGRRPVDRDEAAAAAKLVQAGLSSTTAGRQAGPGWATVHREMAHPGVGRQA